MIDKTPLISGWIGLNKAKGASSMQALRRLKKRFKGQKIGHGGTLDPLAQGVLPVAINEATKLMSYVFMSEKTYEFTVAWGEGRTTDDEEGTVTQTSDYRPSLFDIEQVLPRFCGTIQQTPPIFSAIHVDGKRAYDRARKGQDVELSARPVEIKHLAMIEATKNDATFKVVCGKGTYVRSLARDLGQALGCYGHVTYLNRTQVGPFVLSDACTIDDFDSHESDRFVAPLDYPLVGYPVATLSHEQKNKLKAGQQLPICDIVMSSCLTETDRIQVESPHGFFAMAYIKDNLLCPERIFHT